MIKAMAGTVVTALLVFLFAHPLLAQVVDARLFAARTHAGTASDPWPGSAILAAIASLPDRSGRTVVLAGGVWRVDSQLVIAKNGFTLSGSNRAATIAFYGSGKILLSSSNPSALPVQSVTLSGLRFDAANSDSNWFGYPIHLRNCSGCRVTGNYFGPRANSTRVATLFFQGGGNNQITGNEFLLSWLQFNPLTITANSGFTVSGNVFDSGQILSIGISQIAITDNVLTNRTLGNFIQIRAAPLFRATAQGISIERNTLDATVSPGRENGVLISGLPQDPGGAGALRSFYIRYNTLRGTTVNLNAQVGATGRLLDSCIATCLDLSDIYDLRIQGNVAEAWWTGAVIDLRGGTYGLVDGGAVLDNRLTTKRPGAVHRIRLDAHTRNVTVGLNPSAQQTIVGP